MKHFRSSFFSLLCLAITACSNGHPVDRKVNYSHRYVLRTEHTFSQKEQTLFTEALRSRLHDFYAWSGDAIAVDIQGNSVILQTEDSIHVADFGMLFCEKANIEFVPLMEQNMMTSDVHVPTTSIGTKSVFDSLFIMSGKQLRRLTGNNCGLVGIADTRDTAGLRSSFVRANTLLQPFGYRLTWSVNFPKDNCTDSCMLWSIRDIAFQNPRSIHPAAANDLPDKVTVQLSESDKLKFAEQTAKSSAAFPICFMLLINGIGYSSISYTGTPIGNILTVYNSGSSYHHFLYQRLHLAPFPGKVTLLSY